MKYFLKKLIAMLLTLLVVAFFVFLAFALIPGDPAARKLGLEGTAEELQALREQMGLTGSLPERFWRWFTALLHGDMGTSYFYTQPVSEILAGKIPVTLSLALMAQ